MAGSVGDDPLYFDFPNFQRSDRSEREKPLAVSRRFFRCIYERMKSAGFDSRPTVYGQVKGASKIS